MIRKEQILKLHSSPAWDLVIIGGGATGLGCAVDAANRGYKTLLVEKHDFAKGTSSRSTKLVHGGVRYLAQGNIRLVREALFERGRLLKNAPHTCRPIAFVLPVYHWWQKWFYGFGLWLYEWLSGHLSLGKTSILSKKSTLGYLPWLSPEKLKGGILYFDGQFDDSRLAINLAQTAVREGATVINHCEAESLMLENGKIIGLALTDRLNGDKYTVTCKSVINATGVFADDILQKIHPGQPPTLSPSQGVHLVIQQPEGGHEAGLMIPKTDDGRVLFAIPWQGKLLVGTTDTPLGEINDEPGALESEIEFIISHYNRYVVKPISKKQVLSVFAGLRPLAKQGSGKHTSVMPRDHQIQWLKEGLLHITGGKWTTYRRMAEDSINELAIKSHLPVTACKTKNLPIYGNDLYPEPTLTHLKIYGAASLDIEKMIQGDADLATKIHPDYPFTKAEVKWAIEAEMAMTIEDILARRIRLLFLDARAAKQAAPLVAECLQKWGEISADEAQNQLKAFYLLTKNYMPTPD